MHVTPLVDDGHGIGGRPHLTGPRNMVRTGHVVQQPVIQGRIGSQFGICGRDPMLKYSLKNPDHPGAAHTGARLRAGVARPRIVHIAPCGRTLQHQPGYQGQIEVRLSIRAAFDTSTSS